MLDGAGEPVPFGGGTPGEPGSAGDVTADLFGTQRQFAIPRVRKPGRGRHRPVRKPVRRRYRKLSPAGLRRRFSGRADADGDAQADSNRDPDSNSPAYADAHASPDCDAQRNQDPDTRQNSDPHADANSRPHSDTHPDAESDLLTPAPAR